MREKKEIERMLKEAQTHLDEQEKRKIKGEPTERDAFLMEVGFTRGFVEALKWALGEIEIPL